VTQNCRGAGTDANVYVELFGSKGAVGKTKLETSADNFERNHVSCVLPSPQHPRSVAALSPL